MTTTLSESHYTRAPLYTTRRLAAERLVLLYKFNVFIPVAIMLAGTPLYKFCVICMCGVCMVLIYLCMWVCAFGRVEPRGGGWVSNSIHSVPYSFESGSLSQAGTRLACSMPQ